MTIFSREKVAKMRLEKNERVVKLKLARLDAGNHSKPKLQYACGELRGYTCKGFEEEKNGNP